MKLSINVKEVLNDLAKKCQSPSPYKINNDIEGGGWSSDIAKI